MPTPTVDAVPTSQSLPRRALPLLAAQAAALSLLLIRLGRARSPSRPGSQARPALAIGATAVGALALGALSIGALSMGALAVGHLRLRHAELGKVHIRSLSVDTLILPQPAGAAAEAPTPVI